MRLNFLAIFVFATNIHAVEQSRRTRQIQFPQFYPQQEFFGNQFGGFQPFPQAAQQSFGPGRTQQSFGPSPGGPQQSFGPDRPQQQPQQQQQQIPQTTAGPPTTLSPQVRQCTMNCGQSITGEFNPVCGK